MKILYLDATTRDVSRTRVLAERLLRRLDGDVTHVKLYECDLPTLCGETLTRRSNDAGCRDFSWDYFDYAKQFADADVIVLSAPYWDNSFPAIVKKYIETVSVYNLTFRYSKEGECIGLCRAKKLYYICSAGGYVNDTYGYGYIDYTVRTMFGIPETMLIKAEGLDIVGNNPVEIMSEAIAKIDSADI